MTKPYVFINDRMQTYFSLKDRLSGNDKFDQLNAHLRNIVVVPGQLVIVGDLSTRTINSEELELMSYASGVHKNLRQNQAAGDGHVIKNYDLLQNVLGYSSLGIGSATGSWKSHLDGVKKTLDDIERLHKLSLARGTPIARQEFLNQRQVLFAELDAQLEGIARWGTKLRNRGSIKKMLGISTKSYLHTGEIQGYAKKIAGISKASRILKAGTPIGIGLNSVSTYLEIKEACSTGREEMCRKTKYVEGSKLVSGTVGGMVGGTVGTTALTPLCIVVFSVPSGGLGSIGCSLLAALIGGYAGGLGGEKWGEKFGEMLYEWRS
ncbi:hypothetical protein [Pseudomonas sp. NFR16]|uniref:hypothetical protein n=1 Tax=Pseudomonas sp. NFR16 TaxID=1566248 RepID=UPI0008C0A382|nr:hypothetical protein [Pseudomonas sp. NFR16]SEJ96301.1 hypothetical protein SAMN03159495_0003 [Pseudomonas sp. NFR16]